MVNKLKLTIVLYVIAPAEGLVRPRAEFFADVEVRRNQSKTLEQWFPRPPVVRGQMVRDQNGLLHYFDNFDTNQQVSAALIE